MAIRKVREIGEEILGKKAKEVKKIDDNILELINDMIETMYEENGVGIAAPQVGSLKRIFIVDVSENEDDMPYIFINPEILELEGEQEDYEGCLSVPGKRGLVKRAKKVKVRAFDINMEEFILEAEDLFARAILHEYDHLEGVLYVDKVKGELLSNDIGEE